MRYLRVPDSISNKLIYPERGKNIKRTPINGSNRKDREKEKLCTIIVIIVINVSRKVKYRRIFSFCVKSKLKIRGSNISKSDC